MYLYSTSGLSLIYSLSSHLPILATLHADILFIQSISHCFVCFRSQRKLSAAAQLAQTKEGNVDLETPDSILAGVNVRAILNKHTFSTLPPAYQHRLIQLLPSVDQAVGPDDAFK